ncbi:MAG: hypothetical protein P1V81_13100 [Planctomycetota bacterium]|nr:hypothetical protein [Planctomycetota bacterium]
MSATHRGLLAAGLALLACAGLVAGEARAPGGVLGPVGPMLAQVQWVRARLAREAGLEGRSLALMESARDLDSRSEAAWSSLADHMGLTLASAESGRPGEERAAWLAGADGVGGGGAAAGAPPGGRAGPAGGRRRSPAATDPDLPFVDVPSGARATLGLWTAAARAFDHAAELGHPDGTSAAAYCRRVAADPGTW